MKTSYNGLALIMKFEGLRMDAYLCPSGVLTIGYGHTGSDVKRGQRIDADRARELLIDDVRRFEASVNDLVKVDITQGMFDALVSFCYNLGAGSLKGSTLLKKLNAGDTAGAAEEFLKWDKANGKSLAGLTARREAERQLFIGDVLPTT